MHKRKLRKLEEELFLLEEKRLMTDNLNRLFVIKTQIEKIEEEIKKIEELIIKEWEESKREDTKDTK